MIKRAPTPGDILTEVSRLRPGRQRKVYHYIGPSRAFEKIRIATWSHKSRDWSRPRAEELSKYVHAPEDWPQTKAARKALTEPIELHRRRMG